MDEKQKMLDLAGINEAFPFKKEKSAFQKAKEKLPFGKKKKTKVQQAKEKIQQLSPENLKKTMKKYNRNLKRLTLTDSFADAAAVALSYSLAVAGRTLEDVKDNEIKEFTESLKKRFGFKRKGPDIDVKDIKKRTQQAFKRKITVDRYDDRGPQTYDYDMWLKK